MSNETPKPRTIVHLEAIIAGAMFSLLGLWAMYPPAAIAAAGFALIAVSYALRKRNSERF